MKNIPLFSKISQESESVDNVGNQRQPDNCAKHWSATIPKDSATRESLVNWFGAHAERAAFQHERGESGYEHWQCAFSLRKKNRLGWLKRHLSADAHFEKSRNIEAAFAYACKPDTRVGEPHIHPAPARAQPRDLLQGAVLRPWQATLLSEFDQPFNGRTVTWYVDAQGGMGKTALARHLLLSRHDVHYVTGGKGADIAYSLTDSTKILLMDLPRQSEGHISYGMIEQLANGLVFSAKYESRLRLFEPIRVIVFANWQPDRSMLSADRWDVRELF